MSVEQARSLDLIFPDWPAPSQVRAVSTGRSGGYSRGAYAELNLAAHTGDALETVRRNRALLRHILKLPQEPQWLEQVHGTQVVQAGNSKVVTGDGCVAVDPGTVCAVLTADCLPVLLCNRSGTRVAALHAGWRGLATGILEAGCVAMQGPTQALLAWLGPCIGPQAFEVGAQVREAFVRVDPQAEAAFQSGRPGHWFADLALLARQRLIRAGVGAVYGGHWCTFSASERFFSYRRERTTGRMATLIWLDAVDVSE